MLKLNANLFRKNMSQISALSKIHSLWSRGLFEWCRVNCISDPLCFHASATAARCVSYRIFFGNLGCQTASGSLVLGDSAVDSIKWAKTPMEFPSWNGLGDCCNLNLLYSLMICRGHFTILVKHILIFSATWKIGLFFGSDLSQFARHRRMMSSFFRSKSFQRALINYRLCHFHGFLISCVCENVSISRLL